MEIKKYFEEKYEKKSFLSIFGYVLVALVVLGILFWYSGYVESFSFSLSETTVSIIGLTKIVFVMFIIFMIIFCFIPIRIQGLNRREDIFSLRSSEGLEIEGSFVLGCGSINGTQEDYYVFFKQGEFGLVKQRINSEGIEIIQTDKMKPCFIDVTIDCNDRKLLFVPKNTIRENFEA